MQYMKGQIRRLREILISGFGVMRFGDDDKRIYLAEYFPGVTPNYIRAQTGFDLDVSRAVESEPPAPDVLDILVRKVNPAA